MKKLWESVVFFRYVTLSLLALSGALLVMLGPLQKALHDEEIKTQSTCAMAAAEADKAAAYQNGQLDQVKATAVLQSRLLDCETLLRKDEAVDRKADRRTIDLLVKAGKETAACKLELASLKYQAPFSLPVTLSKN